MDRSIWVGFDPREVDGYAVTRQSIEEYLIQPVPVRPLLLSDLQDSGIYTRETIRQNGLLYDVVSEHPMATEFAISRFLIPHLVKSQPWTKRDRWALFMDSDMLVRQDLKKLFDLSRNQYAVMVVKHNFNPPEGMKMDGQVQSQYARKNWSSVLLFNVDHPSNDVLTPEYVNSLPGRDLHRFCWLKDEEIGELPVEWNYLVGHHTSWHCGDPSIVHFTDGIPSMKGYENSEYADEWNATLRNWVRRR
jgi:lipopolysaccharide biosynthesis glycosyltransferase